MKQLTIEVKESKYKFFLELIKSLEFVHISGREKGSAEKNNLIENIARGMQEAKLASNGKLKSRSAKDFLNEL